MTTFPDRSSGSVMRRYGSHALTFNPLCAQSVVTALPHLPAAPTVVELGNQSFRVGRDRLRPLADRLRAGGNAAAADGLLALPAAGGPEAPLTEDFYRALGFRDYLAIDVNTKYGSVVMDLNRDLADELDFRRTFDLVTNLGTGEHVFDQRRVLENIHNLTAPGGVMVHIMPFVNWLNHGFYNFHPVLYTDLAAANGYRLLELWLGNGRGFHVPVDLDARTPPPPTPVDPGRARARLARLARGVRSALGRTPTSADGRLALTDVIREVTPSAAAPGYPLPRAIERVMHADSGKSHSDYPVMGNVLIVAVLQKPTDAPFTVPMAGRYLADIEGDALRGQYASQTGPEGAGEPAPDPGR
jgi:SAM-dependent methyltransferase